LFGAAENFFHMHELGVTHGRAKSAAKRTERPIRVAVHGREDKVAVDGDVTDVKNWNCLGRNMVIQFSNCFQ